MTKAELMEYVGEKIYVYFKDGESGIYGLLGYADDFSEKHNYRKPNYFYIGHTSFKASHVRKIESETSTRHLSTDTVYPMTNAEAINILTQRKWCGECNTDCSCKECDMAFDIAIKALEQEPRIGHWIEHDCKALREIGYYRCSECNHGYQRYERGVIKSEVPYINGQKYELHRIDKFCPNCGARMESEE